MLWLREQVAQKNALETIPVQTNLIQGSIAYERNTSNLSGESWCTKEQLLRQKKALEACFNPHVSEQSPQGLQKLLLNPKEKPQESTERIKIKNLLN